MARKILTCDDEKHIVRLIQVNLERQGYEVITAYNGAECLEKVEAEQPDLIVLDVMMPEMTGFEVLGSLEKESRDREHPRHHAHGAGAGRRCLAWLAVRRGMLPHEAFQPDGTDRLRQAHLFHGRQQADEKRYTI